MALKTFDEIKVGDSLVYEKKITAEDVKAFLAVTGDENSLHRDEEIAKTTQFNGLIAPGTIASSLPLTAITKYLQLPILMGIQTTFLKPVRINDTVAAKISVVEKVPLKNHVRFDYVCTVGGEVVCKGNIFGKCLK